MDYPQLFVNFGVWRRGAASIKYGHERTPNQSFCRLGYTVELLTQPTLAYHLSLFQRHSGRVLPLGLTHEIMLAKLDEVYKK